MSYRLDAELHHGYGELVPVSPHPGRGENLTEIMIQFGQQNKHLARKQPGERKDKTFACIFVSNCQTKSHRNAFVFFQRYYLTNFWLINYDWWVMTEDWQKFAERKWFHCCPNLWMLMCSENAVLFTAEETIRTSATARWTRLTSFTFHLKIVCVRSVFWTDVML